MEELNPASDRRKDRSTYADEALEKFLDTVRRDNDFLALVLADPHGHLIATSAADFSESSLAALGTISADLQARFTASDQVLTQPIEFQIERAGTENAVAHVFPADGTVLILTIVGKCVVFADQLDRVREGICRILALRRAAL